MNIAIGGDHAGYEYKEELKKLLTSEGYAVKDFGPADDNSCDYPDYVHPLAKSVRNLQHQFGIVICGSGNGVAMVANKHKDVRCALVWNKELVELARQHNNANVLAIPARFVSLEDAKTFAKTFIETEFEGGRHERRVNKISEGLEE
jgi:ribose 5-phosphate isomerase B